MHTHVAGWLAASLLGSILVTGPAAATEDGRKESVSKAIELHDSGNYPAAMKIYQALLEDDPNDALVLYEASLTSLAMKEYATCIKYAERGAAIKSNTRAQAFALLASCKDDAGQTAEALATFASATKEFPNDVSLNYNYGVALLRGGDTQKAAKPLQKAIGFAPAYPSPYLAYAQLLEHEGVRGAAVLMHLRFLMAEPQSSRSIDVAKGIIETMDSMHGENKDGTKTLNISVPDQKMLEPSMRDLLALDLALALTGESANEPKANEAALGQSQAPPSDADRLAAALQSYVFMAGELADNKTKRSFFWKTAVEPLQSLTEQGAANAFCYHVGSLAGVTGADRWIDDHPEEMKKLDDALAALNKGAKQR